MLDHRAPDLYTGGAYLRQNPTWHAEDSPWKASQILKMLERNGIAPRTVAEVGCGAGETLDILHGRFPPDCRLRGFEISPQAFDLCAPKVKDRLTFELADFTRDTTETFEVLLCIDVIEHVEDCFTFLRELRTRARFKVFHIPLDLSVQSVLRETPLVVGRRTAGHVHYFTKRIALSLLEETGHRVVDHFYTPGGLASHGNGSLKRALARLLWRASFALHPDLAVRTFGGYSLMVLTE